MRLFDRLFRSRSASVIAPLYTPSERAERLVAVGRVVLSVASLAAVWIDPSAPAQHAETAYTLLAIYSIYSLILALAVWRWPARSLWRRLTTHIVDLIVFSAVIYFTEGATSPFFLYFIFSLLSATLRFRLKGTFWTAVAALAIFVGMGLWASLGLDDPNFEPNRFLIRSVYLAIVAVLLIYLSVYQEQHREELSRLAAWPRLFAEDVGPLLRDLLTAAATTLRADRAVLHWQEDEKTSHLAWMEGDEFGSARWDGPIVAEPLQEDDFYCRELRSEMPLVIRAAGRRVEQLLVPPLDRSFRERFEVDGVLSTRLRGQRVRGRLLILDPGDITSDDLVLGRIVSEMMAARLDEFYLLQRVKRGAVSDERIRVSRELHDGILQSLTGIALQLKVAERVIGRDPGRVIEILAQVRDLIGQDQRELRRFVQGLREEAPLVLDMPLAVRLVAVAERVRVEWGLHVDLDVQDLDGRVDAALTAQVALLVNEALSNAGKHGRAKIVRMRIRASDSWLRLEIEDDGIGFPFRGTYDLETLNRQGIGPLTLRERVALLGGSLTLRSGGDGSKLEIELPLIARNPAAPALDEGVR